MAAPKLEKAKDGSLLHFSVGAVIEQSGKYLLLDRAHPPFGFAGPGGHVDEGESPEEAVIREVREETGLRVTQQKLLFEESGLQKECCVHKIQQHEWYLFKCEATGDLKKNERETKSVAWYTKEEIKNLKLEPIWKYWFKRLEIL